MTHTPGPWIDSPNTPDAIISTDKGAVREWVGDGTGYMEAGLTYYGGAVICESVRQHDKPLLKAAPDLLDAAQLARDALAHDVPGDCWSTGPNTGDPILDLVVCPGCAAIDAIDAATTKARGQPPKKES